DVVNVSKGTISEYKEVEFKTIVKEDENLLKGKTKIAQEGENGRNNLIYDVVYHNGELVDKAFNKEIVSEAPVNKVVKNGTKVESKIEDVIVASSTEVASSSSVNGKYMSVVATAYAGDTITATGTVPKWGTIAVDPQVIPYGTKVYIPQFNKTFTAEDCGGAIKGNKIDIFMNSNSSVYDWGRRTIDIYIVG
ncbi:MAG: 3D domain-containing protein, partial [Paraclostridium sp.]